MRLLRNTSILLVLATMAAMVAFAAPGRVAHAQPDPPGVVANTLQIYKFCDPEGIEPVLTFPARMTVNVSTVVSPFVLDFEIDCEQTRVLANPPTDLAFPDLFNYITGNPGAFAGADVTMTITETGLAPWWDSTPTAACSFDGTGAGLITLLSQTGIVCELDNTLSLEGVSFLEVNKDFDGPPETVFTFEVATTGDHCVVVIDGGAPLFLADGETFPMTADQTAAVYCSGQNSVTELPGEGYTFDSVACEPDPPGEVEVGVPEPASVTFRLVTGDGAGAAPCTWTNTVEVTDDDPEIPNVEVQKVCVDAEELDGTFAVALDGGEPVEIACGDSTTFVDVEPGTHTLTETIEGDDAADFETVIICNDGEEQSGTEATFEVVAGEDQLCLVINGADVTDLICDECPCGCGGTEIDIDLNNTNNNTIDLDNDNTNNNANDNDNANFNDNLNENKNDNKNENTQNQENTQDQDNSNTQTNNITSSPEVNIDFD